MLNYKGYWTKQLKPCPFCGRVPEIHEVEDHEYFISCRSSYCIEQRHCYRSLRSAVEMWNRRAETQDA